jgi:hypothetical protein
MSTGLVFEYAANGPRRLFTGTESGILVYVRDPDNYEVHTAQNLVLVYVECTSLLKLNTIYKTKQ